MRALTFSAWAFIDLQYSVNSLNWIASSGVKLVRRRTLASDAVLVVELVEVLGLELPGILYLVNTWPLLPNIKLGFRPTRSS